MKFPTTRFWLLTLASLCLVYHASASTRITLCARDLPSTDAEKGAPDTYVNIYYTPSSNSPFELLATTHVEVNDKNPDWSEIYTIPDSGDSTQKLKFDIFDVDEPEEGDEIIGSVTISLENILKQSNRVKWTTIQKEKAWRGSLVIKVQKEEIKEPAEDCSSVECPEDTDKYFPHPTKCNAFCQCSNGTPYEMPCPQGLVFDPNKIRCVYPNEYNCCRAIVSY